ncbi:hypothetical protein K501DRAFT_286234 [Backusella circina FSU 941]|nr:hypothetical protein K501DRAFT_286234 [Backusella circina FSU 941]
MESSTTTRRNSFSAFVKNLILLVSPSNQQEEEATAETKSTMSNSPFEDLYFSFPAFEESTSEESSATTSSCGQTSHLPQSYMVESSRILC